MAKKEALLQAAEKLVSKGKIDAAIKEYKKVLKKTGEDTNTLNRIGDLYARQRKTDDAIQYYSRTAESYSADGFYARAIAVYKKIQRLEPGRLDVHNHLAELYHRQGLTNDARNHYQHLADHYQRQRDAASAIGVYQRMIELEPSNPTPRAKLAELYKQEKLTSKAIEEYGNIARVMIEHQQADQALQVYKRALDLETPSNEFMQTAIGSLMEVGNRAGAEELFEAALQRNPAVEELRALLSGLPGAVPASEAADIDAAVAEPAVAEEPGAGPAIAEPEPGPEVDAPPEAVPPGGEGAAVEHETLVPPAQQPLAQPPSVEPPPLIQPPVGDTPVAQPSAAEESALQPQMAEPQVTQPQPLADSPAAAPGDSPAASPVAPPEEQGEEFEEFVLDFDAEDAPSTLVQPPADMVDSSSIEATVGDEIEIEIEAPEVSQSEGEEWAFEPEPVLESPTYSPEDMELELTDSQLQPQPLAPTPTSPPEAIEPPVQEPAVQEPALLPNAAEEPQPPVAPTEPLPLQPPSDAQPPASQPPAVEPPAEQTPSPIAATPPPSAPAVVQPAVPPAEPTRAEDDLLAEAEVFVKYGLTEKAVDRLRDVLTSNPSHLGAHGQLISLYVQQETHEEVVPLAAAMAQLAQRAGTLEPWNETKEMLVEAGYRLEGDKVSALPTSAPAESPAPLTLEAMPEQGEEMQPPASAFDTFDSGLPGEPAASPPPAAAVEHEPSNWLNELEEPAAEQAQEGDNLFDEEESFFDLAAELQDDLADGRAEEAPSEPHEQSLEEIVEGFKKGVAENLSPEDSDTHYNLGIAYREMMLYDEAIGEFQIAAKDPRYLVDCCAMLGQCFSEKGLPELAVKWFQRGLESPSIEEKQMLGMLYDLGNCYVALEDRESAYKTFVEIYGMDSNYRDVSARMMELQPSGTTN